MKAIWKFPLETIKSIIKMPAGAKILTVHIQNNVPCIWALVNVDAKTEERAFTVYGTGHQHDEIYGTYIGTFYVNDGEFVYHVFETEVS